jgi:peptidoglycan/LPS O-acetylase OafA/YrhL
MDSIFSLKAISKYRTELMGVAIIGVLIGHIIAFNDLCYPTLDSIAHGIHVPGFLFLSGFGIFYSLTKNSNIKDFYVRRFWRFYFPFLLISLPFLLRTILTGKFDIWRFFTQITTVGFWLYGNDGTWYIAVSLVLYLLTPLLFMWFQREKGYCVWKRLLIIAITIGCNFTIQFLSPAYWNKVEIGLKQVPCFFLGMLVAHYSLKDIGGASLRILYLAVCVLYPVFRFVGIEIPYVTPMLKLLFYLIVFCCLFSLVDSFRTPVVGPVLRWFGKYTLELYLLHIYFHGLFSSPLFHLQESNIIISAVVVSLMACMPAHWCINRLSNILQGK